MPTLIVTDDPKDWPSELPEAEVVDAWSYLTGPRFATLRNAKLFNLCKSYRYQSAGYYVSLLAEARGHRPLPSITTIQDMKSPAMVRLMGEELDDRIQKDLHPLQSDAFTLSVYFGRNVAKRYDTLSRYLFDSFRAPMLRAQFKKIDGRWQLRGVAAIGASEVPEAHWPMVAEAARQFFAGRRGSVRRRSAWRYDLAILRNPKEAEPPSDDKALQKFAKAAEAVGLAVEVIGPDDYGRIAEFDALFIRETTAPNHHTYRFSRRAAGEGLVVIDDPESIVRCSNKVYLAELLGHHHIPSPKTLVAHEENVDEVLERIGLPCVLKQPDSSFSRGVIKVETAEALRDELARFWKESDLVVAQEYLPTTFDWRIGILDGQPLFACKYFMARKHWQIIKRDAEGKSSYGKFETLPVELAPRKAVRIATRAAELIGDGLYGVDVKQSGDQFTVIEVNDNPNIEAGVEDAILRDELYRRLADVFLRRIERRKLGYGGGNNRP